ncbi:MULTISPECIES: MFS transporter [Frankia]|uniref:Putativ e Multidrug resistance protein 2 (Multidrug-efflux transporter 2) putative membrane protein n=2 Tax=Frankia TaxID=1854 RepID=Q0RPI3_FRAAA|nr:MULTISPECIES: MFS transporter [Frankia]CAJ60548.1 putativ e Multidrug resistance protein 2 (Multidrug-efflux transporter 2); putative membrane protein [Frankia alni ACN14a]
MDKASASAQAGPSRPGRLLAVLTAATLLQWLGSFAIAPLLPLYLADRHISAAGVGVVMAAFFLGALLSQYAAGRAAAARGHRGVLLVGLAAYGAGCLGLFASTGIGMDAAMRVLQGAGAGAFEVAALTAVAATVAPGAQGRAFSAIYTGQLLGVALGPLLGGFAGEHRMDLVFLGSGAAAVLASLPVLWLLPATVRARSVPAVATAPAPAPVTGEPTISTAAAGSSTSPGSQGGAPPARLLLRRGVLGLLLVAGCDGLISGVYETCWSLLMERDGASTTLIGLTFTLFALPYLVFAWPAGWLADRCDRRRLIGVTTLVLSVTVASYPFLHSIPLIILLSCVEAVALAVAYPAAQSLLAQESAAGDGTGRGQGLFATTQTATTVFAALASGALFAADPRLPFVLAAIAALVTAALLPPLWREVAGTVAQIQVQVGSTARGARPAGTAPGREAAATPGRP